MRMKQLCQLLLSDRQNSVFHTHDAPARASAYNAFGFCDRPGPQRCGFNGRHRDVASGHYLLGNGYRAYVPQLGRFLSPDSLSPFGKGGLNAYAYCAGDPINFSDPSGHVLASVADNIISSPLMHKRLRKVLARNFPKEFTFGASNSDLAEFVMKRNRVMTDDYSKRLPINAQEIARSFAEDPSRKAGALLNRLGRDQNKFTASLKVVPKQQPWTMTFSNQLLSGSDPRFQSNLATQFISEVLGSSGKAPSPKVLKSLSSITTDSIRGQPMDRVIMVLPFDPENARTTYRWAASRARSAAS